MSGLTKHIDFISKYKKVLYSAGETIMRPGDGNEFLYYIDKGYVESYTITDGGDQYSDIIYKEGEIFPYTLTREKDDDHYFQALTDTDVYKIRREEFLTYLKQDSNYLIEFMQLVEKFVTRFNERFQQIIQGKSTDKVTARLLYLAKRVGNRTKKKGFTVIPIVFTHESIAQSIGTTRETVSIQMKKLEKAHCLSYNNNYIVVNVPLLKKGKI